MKLPSKVISFKESSLSKFSLLLNKINEKKLSPHDLYEETKKYFENVEDFIETLDYLYALNKIYFETENGEVINVT